MNQIETLMTQAAARDALIESIYALIEERMGEWYGVAFPYLPANMANLAYMRDMIEAAKAA